MLSISPSARLERMRHSMANFKGGRLAKGQDNDLSISICGYGPSLANTWEEVANSDRIMTTSGAHDFLIERGVIPDYHVECDPRKHKAEFLKKPDSRVTYFINSQCHPTVFDALDGHNVVLWHGFTDDDRENQIKLVEELEPGTRLLAGGTNVGMRAIVVARELGFMDFRLHGMDCCYHGEQQWAGRHHNQRHHTVKVEVEGKTFETSDLMMQSTDDFFKALTMLPGCRFKVYGDGLLEARLRIYVKDREKALSPRWWIPVNFTVNRPLTKFCWYDN